MDRWWKQKSSQGVATFRDSFGHAIGLKHPAPGQPAEERAIPRALEEVLSRPDEIYSTRTLDVVNTLHIRFYRDFAAIIEVTNDGREIVVSNIRAVSVMQLIDQLRQGTLIFRR